MNFRITHKAGFGNRVIMPVRALVWLLLLLGRFAMGAESPRPGPVPDDALPLAGFAGIGSSFAQSSRLNELGWTEEEIQAFIDGVRAGLHGKPFPFDASARRVSEEMGRRVHELEGRSKSGAPGSSQSATVEQYMKEIRKRLRLQQTASGLAYRIEAGRSGIRPRLDDTVVFSCVAHAADGVTDVPQLSAENIRAKVKDLVPGLIEGLQMMTLDSKEFLVIPPSLLFGDSEWPAGMDRNAPVQVQLTLIDVVTAPP